jgi:hypothetical protein
MKYADGRMEENTIFLQKYKVHIIVGQCHVLFWWAVRRI